MTEMSQHEGGPQPRKRSWYRRTWVVATATGVVAFLIGVGGGAASTPDVTSTPEYRTVVGERDAALRDLQGARSEIDRVRSDLEDTRAQLEKVQGNLPEREAALERAQEKLAQREQKVSQREQAVKKAERAVREREKKVGLIEQQIARNTIPGNGIFKVGEDIRPGTYRSSGSSGCYYAVLNSPDTSDIVTNHITSGPTIVTLSEGTFFDTSNCAEWVWQP